MKSLRDLESVLTLDTLAMLMHSNSIRISQLNAVLAVLIRANIPFDLTFSSRTRSDEAEASLKISINPKTTLNFTFEFDSDGC